MYAVIKTGGKQYRVQPGDVIVVEKIDGDAGAAVNFGEVLMLGGDKGVTVGAPLIDGAAVAATLIETRKGEKIKIFKKTRRQGYRREVGVKTAVALVFRQRFVKSRKQTTSNWAARQLTEAQVCYAANDAYAAMCVADALGVGTAAK